MSKQCDSVEEIMKRQAEFDATALEIVTNPSKTEALEERLWDLGDLINMKEARLIREVMLRPADQFSDDQGGLRDAAIKLRKRVLHFLKRLERGTIGCPYDHPENAEIARLLDAFLCLDEESQAHFDACEKCECERCMANRRRAQAKGKCAKAEQERIKARSGNQLAERLSQDEDEFKDIPTLWELNDRVEALAEHQRTLGRTLDGIGHAALGEHLAELEQRVAALERGERYEAKASPREGEFAVFRRDEHGRLVLVSPEAITGLVREAAIAMLEDRLARQGDALTKTRKEEDAPCPDR